MTASISRITLPALVSRHERRDNLFSSTAVNRQSTPRPSYVDRSADNSARSFSCFVKHMRRSVNVGLIAKTPFDAGSSRECNQFRVHLGGLDWNSQLSRFERLRMVWLLHSSLRGAVGSV